MQILIARGASLTSINANGYVFAISVYKQVYIMFCGNFTLFLVRNVGCEKTIVDLIEGHVGMVLVAQADLQNLPIGKPTMFSMNYE